ncbi:MAG: PIN domain-containing protein, partial [Nitrososphaera sp.]|nr:PIN domain-containing protein [Nitrososphaera sp.]
MKSVFADTLYWVATANPTDQWAKPSKDAKEKLGQVQLITTDEVLTEFLAMMSPGGDRLRQAAAQMVRLILENPNVIVVPQSRASFLKGLEFYEKRRDKQYSLTDCISMTVMNERGITQALTNDHHFAQEGFVVLI